MDVDVVRLLYGAMATVSLVICALHFWTCARDHREEQRLLAQIMAEARRQADDRSGSAPTG